MKLFKRTASLFLALLLTFSLCLPCLAAESSDFDYITYPDEAVTEFRPEILNRISSGDDYISNRGYGETSLYISPYWTVTVNGADVPVYSTAVYDYALDRGVLQSFQYIFSDGNDLSVSLTFCEKIENVCVLPEKFGIKAETNGRTIKASLSGFGAYTFLINGDSQEYAVTLFVKENKDQDAEIAEYVKEFGEDRVAVYEKGYYEADTLPTDKDVVYFKRGAFVSFLHGKDIRSDEDAQSVVPASVFELNGKENAAVAGCGTFDFTKLDRKERNLVTVNFCESTSVEGLILLNPNSWTVTAYACENCRFNDITVFGCRTNSDGINICGCNGIEVTDCFCRNGDDSFSAKATNEYYECHDVLFKNCIGWSNKARCFGITGEVERDIYNVTFSDCAVIVRNATWDNDRVASLAVAVETGKGNVHDILFENIEIHKDTGRPFYCSVYGEGITDCEISGVTLKNVTMNGKEKMKISSQRDIGFFGKVCALAVKAIKKSPFAETKLFKKIADFLSRYYVSSNSVSVTFDNVILNGKALKKANCRSFITEGNTEVFFKKR